MSSALSLFVLSFSALSLCRPRSGLNEAVDEVGELVVEGGVVGLKLGSECSAIKTVPDLDPTRQLMMSSWLRTAQWDSSSDVLWWWVCWVCGFADLWVCGFARFVGLLWWWVCGFAVIVGLWVFFFMVVCGWLSVDCGGGFALCSGFLNFLSFFFSFYVTPNTVKYFTDYFPECNQTQEKKLFSLKSFIFANILRWKMIYSETNRALKKTLNFKTLNAF